MTGSQPIHYQYLAEKQCAIAPLMNFEHVPQNDISGYHILTNKQTTAMQQL